MSWLLLATVTLTLSGAFAERNPYTLQSNKYGDLLIAIAEDIPEDLNLVQKIQDGFTAMSRDLFTATKRRAWLGNATILIPFSWSRRPEWEIATTETFETANVIIDDPNPLAGNNPYVNQPGRCAEPGKFMHLTPRYLTDRRLQREWGPVGKTILHEFGHLRWGFFDEYPIPEQGYKRFYHTTTPDGTAVVEPVRCSKMAYGEIMHELTGNTCVMDPKTSLPEEACNFFPPRNKALSPATGSLMFWHFMTHTAHFCDNDKSNAYSLHNDEAPNKHNVLCQGRSQWEIMRDHVDFKDGTNPAINADTNVDTTPDFKIVQRATPRIVLVLDVSGSMLLNNRLVKANQAASEYLRNAVEPGTMVGIVTFATKANITHPLIEIVDDTSRQSLIDALPQVADGSTAIGQGILRGIEVLETQGNPAGGVLLLLSDGIERIPPYIKDVKPTVLSNGVIIDVIRYTDNADAQLLSLAAGSGGMSFYASDKNGDTGLSDALTKTVTDRQQKTVLVKVFGDTFKLAANSSYSANIWMDADIGSNSEFVLTWLTSETPKFTVSLLSPGGSAVAVRKFDGSKILRISIEGNADAGKWVLQLNNPSDTEYQMQVSVTSRARSAGTKPITLTAEVSSNVVDFNDPAKTKVIIYATLTKGYTPLVGANVYAVIESSKNTFRQLLLDNGAGPDTTKEDGVYSAYFLKMDGDGEYSVKVEVYDDSGKLNLKSGEIVSAQRTINVGYLEGNQTEKVNVILIPVSAISRVTSGGFFSVVNQPSGNTDMFAPDTITDLEIVEAIHDTSTVTLRWTAVGDDLDQGQAVKYDLRMSNNIATLRNDFASATPVKQSQLLHGEISNPKPAGQVETFTIQLDKSQSSSTFVFAVKAIDDENKAGRVSNAVPVAFTTKAPERYIGIEEPSTGLSTGALAAIVVSVSAVVIALIVAVGCYMTIKKKNAKVDSEKGISMYE